MTQHEGINPHTASDLLRQAMLNRCVLTFLLPLSACNSPAIHCNPRPSKCVAYRQSSREVGLSLWCEAVPLVQPLVHARYGEGRGTLCSPPPRFHMFTPSKRGGRGELGFAVSIESCDAWHRDTVSSLTSAQFPLGTQPLHITHATLPIRVLCATATLSHSPQDVTPVAVPIPIVSNSLLAHEYAC